MRYLQFSNEQGEKLLVSVPQGFTEVEVMGGFTELFRRFLSGRGITDLEGLVSSIQQMLEPGELYELLQEDFAPAPTEEVVDVVICCAKLYDRHFQKLSGGFLAVL